MRHAIQLAQWTFFCLVLGLACSTIFNGDAELTSRAIAAFVLAIGGGGLPWVALHVGHDLTRS